MRRIIVSTLLTGVVLVLVAGYIMAAVLRVDQTPWELGAWLGANICLALAGLFMWKWLRFDARYPERDMYRNTYGIGWSKVYDQKLAADEQQGAFNKYLNESYLSIFGHRRR